MERGHHMYLYYKIKRQKVTFFSIPIMLLFAAIVGGHMFFETYAQIAAGPNPSKVIQGLADFTGNESSFFQTEIIAHFIAFNIGLFLQLFSTFAMLYGARNLWINLCDRNLLPFLADFRYFYYAIFKYISIQFLGYFIFNSIIVSLIQPSFFLYFALPFLTFSLIIITIILLDLLLSNFYTLLPNIKHYIIFGGPLAIVTIILNLMKGTVPINLALITAFGIVSITLHFILINKIRQNVYVSTSQSDSAPF